MRLTVDCIRVQLVGNLTGDGSLVLQVAKQRLVRYIGSNRELNELLTSKD
jgi:hypothetical protein